MAQHRFGLVFFSKGCEWLGLVELIWL